MIDTVDYARCIIIFVRCERAADSVTAQWNLAHFMHTSTERTLTHAAVLKLAK
jgi:hypothetical protein